MTVVLTQVLLPLVGGFVIGVGLATIVSWVRD